MENHMIPKKYIVAITLSVLLTAGCTPSLKAPALPKPETGQIQKSRPEMGPFGDMTAEEREKNTTSQTQQNPIEPTPESISKKVQFLLPSSAFINERIEEYNKKIDKWRELQNQSATLNLNREDTEKMVNCFRDIQKVLNGYTNMHGMIQQLNSSSPPIINAMDILELQRGDIDFMEGECNRLLAVAREKSIMQANQPPDLSQIETLIKRHWDAKEYEDVVQVWSKIPDSQVGNIDQKTKLLYGNALMFLHQEEQAAEVYQQIVNQMIASNEQKRDLLSLRKILADLYTASGNYPAAQQQYQDILKEYQDLGNIDKWSRTHLNILEHNDKNSPALTQYSGILRNYMGFIPEQDGYKIVWQADKFLQSHPESPVAVNVSMMKADSQKRADAWFNGVFTEVDKLAAEKQYSEAIKKLQSIPDDIINPDQRLKIRDKNDALALSDAVQRETVKISKMQELQRRWNNGLALIDEGKFDEAAEVFNGFQDTEYASKAQEKLKEISTIAAKAERRKAAEYFIRFTKTSDLELKKKLLIESRRLLADILVKYPNIDFADKVRDNIKRVEMEMNTLDPTLLPAILAAEGRQGEAGGNVGPEKPPESSTDVNVPEIPQQTAGKIEEKDIGQ
jgi:tetratricopeptide (TPR) repeat protein